MLFGALALLGLRTLMTEAAWLFSILKIAGGLYLIYLAVMIWRHAAEPIAVGEEAHRRSNLPRSFGLALATQLSNPKIVAGFRRGLCRAAPGESPAVARSRAAAADLRAGDCVVRPGRAGVFVFASAALYLRAKTWIDRAAGAVIGLLGVRLIIEAR